VITCIAHWDLKYTTDHTPHKDSVFSLDFSLKNSVFPIDLHFVDVVEKPVQDYDFTQEFDILRMSFENG